MYIFEVFFDFEKKCLKKIMLHRIYKKMDLKC